MVMGFGVGRLPPSPSGQMVSPQTLEPPCPSKLGTSGGMFAEPELLAVPIDSADA